jgi:hypothetical protein
MLYVHFSIGILITFSITKIPSIDLFIKALNICLGILCVFNLIQFFGTLLFHTPILFNIFGDYLIGGESKVGRFESVGGVFRPTGFYWEPSTNALVTFVLTSCLIILNPKKIFRYLIIQLFFLMLIGSATGIMSSFLFIIVIANRKFKISLFLKLILFLALVSISGFLISDRINEIFREGTSGYYRWAIPSQFFLTYLFSNPFGLPMGQLSYPIDNGIFVALIYFGLLGTIIFSFILLIFMKNFIFSKKILFQFTFIFFISVLISNGAFLTPEMSFLTSILILSIRNSNEFLNYFKK